MERCVSPAWRPKRFAGRAKLRLFISPVREGSIVAKATATGGFRTVRVGKRSSAQTALAADHPGALGKWGLARYRFEQGRSGDRTAHSPSRRRPSQPKCSRLRYRSKRASLLTPLANKCGSRQRPYGANGDLSDE